MSKATLNPQVPGANTPEAVTVSPAAPAPEAKAQAKGLPDQTEVDSLKIKKPVQTKQGLVVPALPDQIKHPS